MRQTPWDSALKPHTKVRIITFNWNAYLYDGDVWWFSLWAVQSTDLHRTVISESQLPQRPVGLTVINCFKGMREQMVLIHRAAYPPSSVQKYSAVPLASQPPAPACCAGSGQTALTTFSSPEDGLSVLSHITASLYPLLCSCRWLKDI